MPDMPFAALLLAGGHSVRMGNDKAKLIWQGQALWQVQLEKLRLLQPRHLLVACREEQMLHEVSLPDVEWLFDPPNMECGPMGPIIQALEKWKLPLLVLAVDMPHMTLLFLDGLVQEAPTEAGLFFSLGHGAEPLAGLYTPQMLPLLKTAWQAGQYSLRRVLGEAQALGQAIILPVSEMDAHLFTNTNTPQDWRRVNT